MAPEIMTSVIKTHLLIFQFQLGKPFKVSLPPNFLENTPNYVKRENENMEPEASKSQQERGTFKENLASVHFHSYPSLSQWQSP